MQLMTSYFYQIRFFQTNTIPISTAVWDPKWYHDNHDQSYVFFDKNNVINGLRLEAVVPKYHECRGQETCKYTPDDCEFLKRYKEQLYNINSYKFTESLVQLSNQWSSILKVPEVFIIFMFHETPDKLCSERWVFTEWVKSLGLSITEFKNYKQ